MSASIRWSARRVSARRASASRAASRSRSQSSGLLSRAMTEIVMRKWSPRTPAEWGREDQKGLLVRRRYFGGNSCGVWALEPGAQAVGDEGLLLFEGGRVRLPQADVGARRGGEVGLGLGRLALGELQEAIAIAVESGCFAPVDLGCDATGNDPALSLGEDACLGDLAHGVRDSGAIAHGVDPINLGHQGRRIRTEP